MLIGARNLQIRVILDSIIEHVLNLRTVIKENLASESFKPMSAIQVAVDDTIVDFEQDEVHQAGKIDFAILAS